MSWRGRGSEARLGRVEVPPVGLLAGGVCSFCGRWVWMVPGGERGVLCEEAVSLRGCVTEYVLFCVIAETLWGKRQLASQGEG